MTCNPKLIDATGWRFNSLDTRILYTPHAGLNGFDKPPNARVVHALCSINSLDGVYPDNTFDSYDYIFCVGPHHLDSFRECARRHPVLLGKTLVPAGYPKLDFMLAKRQPRTLSVRSTVVYAPTHIYSVNEGLASVHHYGEAIINALLSEGHRVIFRPHPVSFWGPERSVVDRICHLHADNPNFSLDMSTDYTASYSSADLMVTDLSGTGFTFSFGFGRPCIFFSPSEEAERGLRGIQFDARHCIGASVRDIDKMIEKVSELCDRDMANEIDQFRNETVFNVGKSAPYIVDCLEDILAGRERPEWVRL
jgi:CDP-glycerol glycerophosphotransferase (TagB/SpsB family)